MKRTTFAREICDLCAENQVTLHVNITNVNIPSEDKYRFLLCSELSGYEDPEQEEIQSESHGTEVKSSVGRIFDLVMRTSLTVPSITCGKATLVIFPTSASC